MEFLTELPQETQFSIYYGIGVLLNLAYINLVVPQMPHRRTQFERILASLLWPFLCVWIMANFIYKIFSRQQLD